MVDPVEVACLATILGLNTAGYFTDVIPMQINMTF